MLNCPRNLLNKVKYFFTAKHSESDLLNDKDKTKDVEEMAAPLLESHVVPDIAFATGKSFPCKPESLKALSASLGEWKNKHKEGKLAVFGHADAVGEEAPNKGLSLLRWKGMLIGKIGNRRGLKFIRNWKSYLENDPDESNAVLGKLGDAEGERKLIEAYLAEKDGTRKEAFALLLGYMATPKALNTLAIDLRTPFTYAWNQRAQRSFRLHVIDALSRAYPFEPLLWRTIYRPTGDSYYEEIEHWAEKTIGVKFTRPRPPFLYQEDAPMMRPR